MTTLTQVTKNRTSPRLFHRGPGDYHPTNRHYANPLPRYGGAVTVRDTSPTRGPKRKTAGSTEELLAAIVRGMTIAFAAKAAGMSEATAKRRLRDPEVVAQLSELRSASLATTADRLSSLAHHVAVILGDIAADTETPAGVRVQACNSVLSHSRAFRDASIVEERLAAIEQHLEAERIAKETQRLRLAGGSR